MTVGIFVLALAGSEARVEQWLRDYDPESHGGRGEATFTRDPAEAMAFVDAEAAIECWRTVSVVRPRRHDGHPNRPLTAFTMQVKPLPIV